MACAYRILFLFYNRVTNCNHFLHSLRSISPCYLNAVIQIAAMHRYAFEAAAELILLVTSPWPPKKKKNKRGGGLEPSPADVCIMPIILVSMKQCLFRTFLITGA